MDRSRIQIGRRATDGFGNASSPTTVTFTQTVKPPALRVFGFDNNWACDSDSIAYFNLGDTRCSDTPPNNFAQALNGSLPSRLRISRYQVQNPNRIPARVRLRNPLVNLAARVGVKYSIPETNGFQWDTLATCPPDDYGDILQDGRCYSLPWPGRDGSESNTSHLGILDRVVYRMNGQLASSCAGCEAGEYEIPPGDKLIANFEIVDLSFLVAGADEFDDLNPYIDLPSVTGVSETQFRHCDRVSFHNGNTFCTQFSIREAVRHITRARLSFTTVTSVEVRTQSAGIWQIAPGLNTEDFYVDLVHTTVETGSDPF